MVFKKWIIQVPWGLSNTVKLWLCAKGLSGKQADRHEDRFRHRQKGKGVSEMRRRDTEGLKEIRQERRKTDKRADSGNQMGWDQTGYCRRTGWGGGVPPAEVLREGHLICVCVCACVCVCVCVLVSMHCILFGCVPCCVFVDFCLSVLVGDSQCLSE